MVKYINFITLAGNCAVGFGESNEMLEAFSELFFVFCKSKPIGGFLDYNPYCIVTQEIKNKIFAYVEKHYDVYNPIYKLRKIFENVDFGETIFVMPTRTELRLTLQESHLIFSSLQACKNGSSFSEAYDSQCDLFNAILENYVAYCASGDNAHYVGEGDKSKRVCRYCRRKSPDVTFRKKAHAISEGLGNKKIVTRDECDSCNEMFGNGIERSMMEYLNLFRTVFGVHGKNGIPRARGENYEMTHKEGVGVEIVCLSSEKNDACLEMQLPLKSCDTIIAQDVYRCLVKYALAIVDESHIGKFSITIDWINKKVDAAELPSVAKLTTYTFFDDHPSIVVYIRNNNNESLPYAFFEFHFTCLVIVAIIPMFDAESEKFNSAEFYELFWNSVHYSKVAGWTFEKLHDNTPKTMVYNLLLKQIGSQ